MDQREHTVLATLQPPSLQQPSPPPWPAGHAVSGQAQGKSKQGKSEQGKSEHEVKTEVQTEEAVAHSHRGSVEPAGGWRLNSTGNRGVIEIGLVCSER